MRRHGERGQTLPVWVLGIIATLGIMFFALNYGNAVRMQIRAQNAADAAAQNLLAIQTERFNLMLEMLYASNIEEFRARKLLDGMLLAIDDSGSCQLSIYDFQNASQGRDNFANGQCAETYNTLRTAFMKSVNRYSMDIKLLNDVSALANDTNWATDAGAMLAHMKTNCNAAGVSVGAYNAAGGDCLFKYTVPTDGVVYTSGLYDVEMDAYGDLVPGLGRYPSSGKTDTEASAKIFKPAKIEVVVCAAIPPLIPNFGPLHAQTYYAIARSAAQSTQFVQDWLQPGAIYDPARAANTDFQPYEIYNGLQPSVAPTKNPWYDVDFGGNPAIATSYNGAPYFAEPFYGPELSARLGWWNAIPVAPFSTQVSKTNDC